MDGQGKSGKNHSRHECRDLLRADHRMSDDAKPPFFARTIHRSSVLIVLAWLAITIAVSVAVPSLEQVEKQRQVSVAPKDAPSIEAMKRIGEDFKESDSDSVAMIVLEGQQLLGDDAHRYYDNLVHQLEKDPSHVRHVQNFWGDPFTAGGAQSADGKAAYVQLSLAGNQSSTQANESVKAVRDIVAQNPPPSGIKVYVTGPAALIADVTDSGDKTIKRITATSLLVIFTVLLFVYRSVITVVLLLLMVGIELQAARGIVALLGQHQIINLSTFAVNLLVSLGIAAGTDYGIFFIGRYQEARQAGEDRKTAYFTTYRGVAKVVLASGLTIAGAAFCLSFTRMPYFQTVGIPCAVGMIVAVAIALTLVPAVLAIGGRFGLFEPRRMVRGRGWRRVGAAVTRWPAPILAATCAVSLIGLLALTEYKTNYHDREYVPKDIPANLGYAAASRHFSLARLLPEILLVESDHDLRNPADLIVLDKLAKGVLAVPGIARVQSVTRPAGSPLAHTSIPSVISMANAAQLQDLGYQQKRMNDLLDQAAELSKMIGIMQHMYGLLQQLVGATHDIAAKTHEMQEITNDIRDHISDFEDFFRPIRSYFYWEKHCYDIPICWSLRSVFESIDSVDAINDKLVDLVSNLDQIDLIMPQLLAQFPEMISTLQSMQAMMLTMHSTMTGIFGEMESSGNTTTAMGQAFDKAQNDDSFYLPPAVLQTPEFKRIMKVFLSPDGKAARLIISDRGDPATPEGISRVAPLKNAAEEALKSTPLENAKIYIGGASATYKDLGDGSKYDLLIVAISALCLIFIIMLIVIRSFVAAMVIVGTVLLSLGVSFGLSVLFWKYVVGIELHWLVPAMSVIILLAVGSDYNLLLVSRMKEETGAGINTGIIRAMAGTGRIVTSAGLVFAFTMASMMVSDLKVIGQVGTTIGLGLLFDTLVVRAFMTPSIAALLGRWFWWPQRVRPRPASQLLRPYGSRPLVRALLTGEPSPSGGAR
jgi:putative drug exporter of the RND superfamily